MFFFMEDSRSIKERAGFAIKRLNTKGTAGCEWRSQKIFSFIKSEYFLFCDSFDILGIDIMFLRKNVNEVCPANNRGFGQVEV